MSQWPFSYLGSSFYVFLRKICSIYLHFKQPQIIIGQPRFVECMALNVDYSNFGVYVIILLCM